MINTLILDVDGVLTDGAISYGDSGETIKKFHIRDGKGIQLAKLGGMKIYVITTSAEKLIRNRAKKLGMEKETFLGIKNKFKCLEELKVKKELKFESIAFVGDDVNDIGKVQPAIFAGQGKAHQVGLRERRHWKTHHAAEKGRNCRPPEAPAGLWISPGHPPDPAMSFQSFLRADSIPAA